MISIEEMITLDVIFQPAKNFLPKLLEKPTPSFWEWKNLTFFDF